MLKSPPASHVRPAIRPVAQLLPCQPRQPFAAAHVQAAVAAVQGKMTPAAGGRPAHVVAAIASAAQAKPAGAARSSAPHLEAALGRSGASSSPSGAVGPRAIQPMKAFFKNVGKKLIDNFKAPSLGKVSLELGLEPLKPELVLEKLSGKTAFYSMSDKKIHLGSSQKFYPHVVRHELAHYYADHQRMFSGIVTVPMDGFAPLQKESREAEAESHLMGELQAYNRQAIEVLQGLHHGTWKAELPVDKWFVELAPLYVKNYKQFMRKILDANSDLVRRTYFGKDPKGEQKVAVICEDLLENLGMSRNPTMKDVLAAELPDVGALEEEFLKQKLKL